MGSLDTLFADLLRDGDAQAVTTPGDIGDSGDNPRQCPCPSRSSGGDTLATSGDTASGLAGMSPDVATLSPASGGPQTRTRARLSPESPMSPAVPGDQGLPCGPAWSDVEIERFAQRYARLVARGLTDDHAEALAERLVQRDREGDARRLCIECSNFRAGRCQQPKHAGVGAEVGALAFILQHCPAFALMGGEPC